MRERGSNPLFMINMRKTIKLSDIAEIRLGMAFKSAIKEDFLTGSCYLIQTKDITPGDKIDLSNLTKVQPETHISHHSLSYGNILLRLRGPVFSAAIFESVSDLPVVTTNQTAVIICDRLEVSPHFLLWYINSNIGQRYFSEVSEGTNINKISAKIIGDMPIELPSRMDQERIANINQTWLQQKHTYKKLIENGDTLFNKICNNIQQDKFRHEQ